MIKINKGFVIAIDGPAAAGKGTIVQMLTELIDGVNIYTGGMFRALGLKCRRNNIALDDEEKVIECLHSTDINLGKENDLGIVAKIYMDGEDVTEAIKSPEAGLAAGKMVLIKQVREEMVKKQYLLAQRFVNLGRNVILDGQDTALIYPKAKIKIFLTANQKVRAERRQKQYEKRGIIKTFESVLREIEQRDERDWSRKFRPLSPNPVKDGYFLVDSTSLNEKKTFNIIKEELKKRGLINDKN